jgi:anti-anti-sigma regulatory factor
VRALAPATLDLDTEHTQPTAAALHARLAVLVSHGSDVTINAAATQRIDASGLQLLLAFVRDRSARGLQTRWHDPTRVIERTAARIGLQALMHFDWRAA